LIQPCGDDARGPDEKQVKGADRPVEGTGVGRRIEDQLTARGVPIVIAIARRIKPVYVPVRKRIARTVYARGGTLETDEEIRLEELDLAAPERGKYEAAGWSILPRILPAREVSGDDVFIDYGSGMGRIVYEAAARYRFKRVIGLELSDHLNQIARSNLDRNSKRLRCSNIQLVTADALEYQPPSDVTVAFFFNPFVGRTFETVVRRLLDAAEHRLRIIYSCPVEHELLMSTGRLTEQRRRRGWRPVKTWAFPKTTIMYEYQPQPRAH
jgi:precorrin-6B methylase 2